MNKTSSWMSRQPALILGPAGSVDQFTSPLRLVATLVMAIKFWRWD
ncbi:MAG: hypothetical protein PWR10_843 [Halanaerobiales bacterium]|nr:hypothetical protein [Halanaerobiales bacterium]